MAERRFPPPWTFDEAVAVSFAMLTGTGATARQKCAHCQI